MIKLSQPSFGDSEIEAVAEVLRSGMLVQGKKVNDFENSFAKYTGSLYAVAVSSGTAALHLALLSLNIGAGDAVIVPDFTFPATSNVVELVGAKTVLVDVNPTTYCISIDSLKQKIQNWQGPERLKAIMIVHEFGAPANMHEIIRMAKEHNLKVIEDAACALGTTWGEKHVGTFGDIGCFSLHPRKAITTGEGGMMTTDDERIYNLLLKLRNHGIERDPNGTIDYMMPGLNYRMTEFQAVLGHIQLDKFNQILEIRKALASKYHQLFSSLSLIQLPEQIIGHSWQTYMIVLPDYCDQREAINYLRENGIEVNFGANALHMLTYYKKKYELPDSSFPVSSTLYNKGLALPLHPFLTTQEQQYIFDTLKNYVLNKAEFQRE